METWESKGLVERIVMGTQTMWKDILKGQLAVPPDNIIHRRIMDIWHEGTTGGHLGRDEITCRINEHYYWPGACTVAQHRNAQLTGSPGAIELR